MKVQGGLRRFMRYRITGRLGVAVSLRGQLSSAGPEYQIFLRSTEGLRNMLNLVSSRGQENPGGTGSPGNISSGVKLLFNIHFTNGSPTV